MQRFVFYYERLFSVFYLKNIRQHSQEVRMTREMFSKCLLNSQGAYVKDYVMQTLFALILHSSKQKGN